MCTVAVMAVTPSKVREYRRMIGDVLRAVGDDDAYRDFADSLRDAEKVLDDLADERGQMREGRGPKLGDRVKRDDSQSSDATSSDSSSTSSGSGNVPENFRR